MTDIIITIPTEHVQRVLEGICGRFGYRETIEEDGELVPNPITRAQFSKAKVVEHVIKWLIHYEKTQQIENVEEIITLDVESLGIE